MFGILLITLGILLAESAESFGKLEVKKKEEGIFTMGIINMFVGFIILLLSVFFGQKFIVSLTSLPTLIPSLFFELLQTHVTILAITRADRSTFSLFRTITIPLLLLVDVILGYTLEFTQLFGIFIIMATILVAGYRHVLKKSRLGLVLFTGINAVICISLYKYDISNFNSVIGEQVVVSLFILIYLGIQMMRKREEPLASLFKFKFLAQSSAVGIGGLMVNFAYAYAPASVILAASRALSMLWSTLAGWKYFGEKNLLNKLIVCFFLIIGVTFLI